jgi:ferredoxin
MKYVMVRGTPSSRSEDPAMKIAVDYDKCSGLGMCESVAPDVFEVEDDGSLTLHLTEVPEGREDEMRQACEACPTEALSLQD